MIRHRPFYSCNAVICDKWSNRITEANGVCLRHWTRDGNECILLFFLQQLAALLITKQVVGNVKEALIPFVKQKVKEWKMKKEEAKAKKEKDEKGGKDKAAGNEKSDKPKELDTPLMNQAEIESTMAEYEVR